MVRIYGRKMAMLGAKQIAQIVRRALIDMRTAARLLREMSHKDMYFVCWVYNYSFHTFNQFKQLVTNSGFEYGWSPMTVTDSLTLTKRKVEPPPPL